MTDYIKTMDLFKDSEVVKLGDGHTSQKTKIQLLTIEGLEKFSIWSNPEKKFYREGEYIEIDGEEKEVNRYIKLTDEQKKNYSRNLKFVRDLIFEGTEYTYDTPKTVNDAIDVIMKTLQSAGQNPLEYEYIIERKVVGTKAWDIEYSVTIGDKIKIDASEELTINIETDSIELTDKESLVIKEIKKSVPNYTNISEDALIKPLLEHVENITDERARKIVKEYLR